MSNSIEVVTHAYSGHHDQYRAFLALQMESLIRNPQRRIKVYYTICTHFRDYDILGTAALFSRRLERAGVVLQIIALDKPHLHRRAIGRNRAARSSLADVLWFCDVDYWFGHGCLKSVVDRVEPQDGLHQPGRYYCNVDHETGDRTVNQVIEMLDAAPNFPDRPPLDGFEVLPAEFFERKSKVAIGGLQIIGAKRVADIGYLHDTEWMEPKQGKQLQKGVQRTRDDVAFRRINELGRGKRIPVKNLFRFRHTEAGRDITDDQIT